MLHPVGGVIASVVALARAFGVVHGGTLIWEEATLGIDSASSWATLLRRRTTWAAVLALIGFLLTVVLAILASSPEPSPTSISVVMVLLVAIAQFGSARLFHSVGRADPGLARSSVLRLIALARSVSDARRDAERAFDSEDPDAMRMTMGKVSVHFSYIESGLAAQQQDWMQFHEEALRQITDRSISKQDVIEDGDASGH